MAWVRRWTASSNTSATPPNSAHTARYPPAKQASSRPRPAWAADTSVNSRSRGTADGSIMAATITRPQQRVPADAGQAGGAVGQQGMVVEVVGQAGGVGGHRGRPGQGDGGRHGGREPAPPEGGGGGHDVAVWTMW